MIMSLDIGNSHIHGALYTIDGNIVCLFRIRVCSFGTSDELGVLLRSILESRGYNIYDVQACVCACVVLDVIDAVRQVWLEYYNIHVLFVDATIDTGIHLAVAESEVGADLIVTALGARLLVGEGNILIVDLGTANTITALSASDVFLGGAIFPGFTMATRALAQDTALLPMVKMNYPQCVVGTNTHDAIIAGLYYGNLGCVRELIMRMQIELQWDKVTIVGTGGFSSLFSHENIFDIVEQNIAHKGLFEIYNRNKYLCTIS